jgi:hypothetical protein
MADYAIFPSLKSPVQINTAKKQLKEIVAAGEAGISLKSDVVTKFTEQLAKPTYIEVTPVDANGMQTVRMSAEGTAAVTAADSAPAAPKAAKTPITFALVDSFVPPVSTRAGGTRTSMYPFATMAVGQAFFVAATTEVPHPEKSLASTVSAATRRYSLEVKNPDGTVKTKAGRKAGNVIPVRENTKVFGIAAGTSDNTPNGTKGAWIYRKQDAVAGSPEAQTAE